MSNSNQSSGAGAAWSPDQFEVPPQEGKLRFHDLDLPSSVLRGISELGYQYCSDIQALSLPHSLQGKDLIGKSQTGTGKTAAFLIAAISQLLRFPLEERYASEPRVLVLAPTRELVMQISKDARAIAKYTGLNILSVLGGMDYQKQKQVLRNQSIDLLVATPGRLMDFMRGRDVLLNQVEILVIDEADRMLDMGFIPDAKTIVRATPPKQNRQTMLFSATFSDDIMALANAWTFEAHQVEIAPTQVANERVEKRIYLVEAEQKYPLLLNILRQEQVERAIVFANRRDLSRDLYEKLKRAGVRCDLLSGEVAQKKRLSSLERFKQGRTQVLVATDVAGRGIHIDGISHVFNYNLPDNPEDYVHRIGRTGRAGEAGVSISFACEDEAFVLPDIEEYLGEKLEYQRPSDELLRLK